MAPGDSKRSKKSKKKNQSARNKPANGNGKEKTGGFQRLDAIEKLPSNAPTMAIAPSDYEHIFHEGPPPPPPPAAPVPPPPPPAIKTMIQTPTHSPSPPPPPLNMPRPRTPEPMPIEPVSLRANQPLPTSYSHSMQYGVDIQVTPDGYTLLGQIPDGRRVALPPHVVRANNQFSRPVLAKVGRYLLSRADVPR